MGFLDMGPMEILLVLIIALIIWGPGKIPEIAKTLGRTINTLRKASLDLTKQIKNEIDLDAKEQPSKQKTNTDDKSVKIPGGNVSESNEGETTGPEIQSGTDE
jgi:sec-independent protein translocase protein TatA